MVLKIKESRNVELVQKHIMSVTVVEVYSRYKVKFLNDKIGLILFRKPKVKQCKYLKLTGSQVYVKNVVMQL